MAQQEYESICVQSLITADDNATQNIPEQQLRTIDEPIKTQASNADNTTTKAALCMITTSSIAMLLSTSTYTVLVVFINETQLKLTNYPR